MVDKELGEEIFCRYIRRNGKIIFPKKAKVFHFYLYRNINKTTQE